MLQTYTVGGAKREKGKDYEISLLGLFPFQIMRHTTDDFSLAYDVSGVGKFDDIVLRLDNHTTFMVQLKYKNNPEYTITKSEYLTLDDKRQFCLKKYINSMCALREKSNSNTDDFIRQLDTFNNINCLIYTNARDTESCDFLELAGASDDVSYLSFKPDSKICKVNVASVSFRLGLTNVTDINNCYLFYNQINPEDAFNKVEEEIKRMTGSDDSADICKQYIQFIKNWGRGDKSGSNYCLTKHDILSKLTELSVEKYKMDFSRNTFTFFTDKEQFVWNKIINDKSLTVIDTNDSSRSIAEFLFKYVGSKVKRYFEGIRKENWCNSLSEAEERQFDGKRAKFDLAVS